MLDQHYLGDVDWNGVLVKGGRKDDHEGLFVPTDEIATTDSPFASGSLLSSDPSLGDSEGAAGVADNGGIQSADSFDQWFRDVLVVNVSAPLTLTFLEQDDDGLDDDDIYVFDDTLDVAYAERGGFFPIDGRLLGNAAGYPDHNFHFTFEAHARFEYDGDDDDFDDGLDDDNEHQFIQVSTDGSVWIFINGKLAIDLGGVQAPTTQYVNLDRLGLVDDETYTLSFFYAQRHRSRSHLRIVTNLELTGSLHRSTISAAFD